MRKETRSADWKLPQSLFRESLRIELWVVILAATGMGTGWWSEDQKVLEKRSRPPAASRVVDGLYFAQFGGFLSEKEKPEPHGGRRH